MSLRMEQLSEPHDASPIFTSQNFRRALAHEFKLQPVDIRLPFRGQSVHIPAFLRSPNFGLGKQVLVIGAGFDKTGELAGLDHPDRDYAACITHLLGELATPSQPLADIPLNRVGQVELRTTHTIPCQTNHSDKVELVVNLDKPCAERIMEFSKSTRRNIRQPFKQGFHFEMDNRPELLDAFYQLYVNNIHALGSLPHAKAFFEALCAQCHDQVGIFVGYMDGQAVVSSFVFLSKDEAYGAWSGTHPSYKKDNVFLTMLWSITEYCEQTGRKRYNLGRSSLGSGACEFKSRLANETRPIHYYTLKPTGYAGHPARSHIHDAAAWLIRNSPPAVMHLLSRSLLPRFY